MIIIMIINPSKLFFSFQNNLLRIYLIIFKTENQAQSCRRGDYKTVTSLIIYGDIYKG